jgi:hypothetical protein
MNARALSDQHLAEAAAFPVGSLDWEYLARAAWKLDQLARHIPVIDWTDEPPEGLAAYIERMEIAA